MNDKIANRLISELISNPFFNRDGDFEEQLPKLFVPTFWSEEDAVARHTLQGRVTSCFMFLIPREDQDRRVVATFKKALKIVEAHPGERKPLDGEANKQSPLFNTSNPQLEKLEAVHAKTVMETDENITNHSLLHQLNGLEESVDVNHFEELFGFKSATIKAQSYWTRFLDLFPQFKHEMFPQHQRLMSAARKHTQKIGANLKGKSVAASDRILGEEAAAMHQRAAGLNAGESMMFDGSYGPKVSTFKTLFRLIQSQHHSYTDWIPNLFKNRNFLEDPKQYLKDHVHFLLRQQANHLSPQQKQFLAFISEDPSREYVINTRSPNKKERTLNAMKPLLDPLLQNGIIGNIDRIASPSPSLEVINLLRLLTYTPGIDSYMITGMFFYLFGMMKWLPQDKMLEVIRWVGDNATRFSHPETRDETLDDLEKYLDSIIDNPIEELVDYVSNQFEQALRTLHRNIFSSNLAEALYESYPLDYPLLHAPYWFKLEKDAHGTYTAHIYSSGHALNYHTHEEGKIQWPMRISHIPAEKLSPAFFRRLLLHRFKANYDLDYLSRADDLWGEEGTFSSLRTPHLTQQSLEWRPYSQTFDTEWELLQAATTTGNPQSVSLFMHVNAIVDFLRPYRNKVGAVDLKGKPDISALLEKGVKVLIREYQHSKGDLNADYQQQIEWTIYELREIVRIENSENRKTPNDPEIIPSFLVRWIKNAMLSSNITSEHVMQFRHTMSWLFGDDITEAVDLILKSADATTATTHSAVIASAKGNALQYIDAMNIAGLKENFNNIDDDPDRVVDALNALEQHLMPLDKTAVKKLIDTIDKNLNKNHPAHALFHRYVFEHNNAALDEAIRAIEEDIYENAYDNHPNHVVIVPRNSSLNLVHKKERTALKAMRELAQHHSSTHHIFLALDRLPSWLKQHKEVKQIPAYLESFVREVQHNPNGVRIKDLDLARILIMRLNAKHAGYFATMLESINKVRFAAIKLDKLRQLKSECTRIRKHQRLQKVHAAAQKCFDSLAASYKFNFESDNQLSETKKAFKVLKQSIVSNKDLDRANKQLIRLEKAFKGAEKSPKELTMLRQQLKKRVSIEKEFMPSKGWLRDTLGTIYVQTVMHVLNLALSLEHWSSPITLFWLYEAFIGILPEPIGTFIDDHVKAVVEFILEKLLLFTLNVLTNKGVIEPALVETLYSYRGQANSVASTLTGKRRVNFKLPKPVVTKDPNRAHASDADQVRSLLLAFSRFASPDNISYARNETSLTEIRFNQYGLRFEVRPINNELRGVNLHLFGNYAIAKNQEDRRFIRYGSYLLLENEEGKKKIILPSNGDVQALGWRLIKKLGPLSGILGNIMHKKYPIPHRGKPYIQYTYDVDAKNRLVSNDPEALAHLTSIEVMMGNPEKATHACDQLLHVLESQQTVRSAATLEKMLWPLAVAPAVLENNLTIDETGNLFRIRQKLFAALQKKMPDNPRHSAGVDFVITLALYQDLQRMVERRPFDRESATAEKRDEEEWLLYQSLMRHFSGFRNTVKEYIPTYDPILKWSHRLIPDFDSLTNILSLTPSMGRRLRLLQGRFGAVNVKQNALHFLRDMVLAEAHVPTRSPMRYNRQLPTSGPLNFSDTTPLTLLGNTELVESEVPSSRFMTALYRTGRSFFDCLSDPKINWPALSKSMSKHYKKNCDVNAITRDTLITDFVTYYAIARGEEGDARRLQLKNTLKTHKGGWDRTTRVLIELLLTMATPPLEMKLAPRFLTKNGNPAHTFYVEKLFPTSDKLRRILVERRTVMNTFFRKLIVNANNVQTAYIASKPLQNLATWFAKGPLLGMLGGRTALYPWLGIPAFFLGTKVAHVLYNEEQQALPPTSTAPPARGYWQLAWEEDKKVDSVLDKLYDATFEADGAFKLGQTPSKLFQDVKGHRNALKHSFEVQKSTLLNLVNPQRTFASYRKPVTYKELLHSFFKGDYRALCKEIGMDPHDLELVTMRLIAKETRLMQMDEILRQLQDLGRVNHTPLDIQLQRMRALFRVRRRYNGDTQKTAASARRYLCYELGHGRLLNSEQFRHLEHKLQKANYFDSILAKTLIKY